MEARRIIPVNQSSSIFVSVNRVCVCLVSEPPLSSSQNARIVITQNLPTKCHQHIKVKTHTFTSHTSHLLKVFCKLGPGLACEQPVGKYLHDQIAQIP